MNFRWFALGAIIGGIPGIVMGSQIMYGWVGFAVLVFLFSFIPMSMYQRDKITREWLKELKEQCEKARERAEVETTETKEIT
jgi:hypothetical protein